MRGEAYKNVAAFDWLLAAVAATVFVLAARALIQPSDTSAQRPEQARIAVLDSTIEDIRRRPRGTLVWDELSSGAALAEGDSIFVPPTSAATIRFDDGTLLQLDENTLVALERPDTRTEAPRVRVSRGNVVGESGDKGLQLATPSGEASLSKQSSARLTLEDGASRVDVLEGTAELGDGSSVGANQSAIASSGDWAKAAAYPMQLSAPAHMARIYFSGESPRPVPLGWSGPPAAGSRLEIRAGGTFGEPLLTAGVEGSKTEFLPPAPGNYTWRLVDADGAPISEARRIIVVRDEPPGLVTPPPDEVIPGYAGRKAHLSWTAVGGARGYEVQLATDPEFTNVLLRREVDSPTLRLGDLEEGRYHWRVRTFEPSVRGESPWSQGRRFRFLTKPLPEAPSLMGSELELTP